MNNSVYPLIKYLNIMADTANTQERSENVKFLTIEQFKSAISADSARVLKNEATGKLFLSASTGETYKVQQDIDPQKEMKVLVADDDLSEACLINVDNTATEVFSI